MLNGKDGEKKNFDRVQMMEDDDARLDHDGGFGTVERCLGAYGNPAAATSTGGIDWETTEEFGDTPIIGAGTRPMSGWQSLHRRR